MKKIIIAFLILFVSQQLWGATIWCNPDNNGTENGATKATGYNTLWEAFTAMSANDTIIIADGDWSATASMSIIHPNWPVSGTDGNYSVIQAETDWAVRLPQIEDQGVGKSYIQIQGIIFDGRSNGTYPTERGHVLINWHHTKFIKCGFLAGKIQGNNHTCGFGSSSPDPTDNYGQYNHHNLMEDCIAWGGGRYVFYDKYSRYNIFRRCVARHDYHDGDGGQDAGQIFNFREYACRESIHQNCISIDSDRVQYYYYDKDVNNDLALQGEAGGFWVGGLGDHTVTGSISIKDVQLAYYFATPSQNQNINYITNSVSIDVTVAGDTTLTNFFYKSNHPLVISNCLGANGLESGFDGFYGKNSESLTVIDSIVENIADTALVAGTATYTNYWNTGSAGSTWGTGATTYDPELNGLLYPVRIESGSTLETAGSGGGVCGPTILKKIGVSETIYGETGWDTVTSDNLWPFPNEDTIKTLMSTTVEGVSGEYGFCTGTSIDGSAQTLTKYIWEQLGNQIPSTIYGGKSITTGLGDKALILSPGGTKTLILGQ